MTVEERRTALLNTIREAKAPISGTALAKKYRVSRQIIVQDIALIRTQHTEIQATPRGYVMLPASQTDRQEKTQEKEKQIQAIVNTPQEYNSGMKRRIYCVKHTDEQIEDELNTIVDMGGMVLDVFVKHELYGSIRADLFMKCRRNVQEFLEAVHNGQSMPLKNLTSGVHYHTVEAESEEILDIIEDALRKKGYLMK